MGLNPKTEPKSRQEDSAKTFASIYSSQVPKMLLKRMKYRGNPQRREERGLLDKWTVVCGRMIS